MSYIRVWAKPRPGKPANFRVGPEFNFSTNPKEAISFPASEVPARVQKELDKPFSMLLSTEVSDAPLCIGVSKKGKPCVREAEPGFKTCEKHRSQEAK